MDAERAHWDKVYESKAEAAVSWYQPHSALSLKLIAQASPDGKASVIDVGVPPPWSTIFSRKVSPT